MSVEVTIFICVSARHLQHLISLLTPVYWTTATEIDSAVNGYTLTKGQFNREVQVEFATGESLTTVSLRVIRIEGLHHACISL